MQKKLTPIILCIAASLSLLALVNAPAAETPDPVIAYSADGQLKFPVDYRQWVFLSSGVGMTYGPVGDAGGPAPPMFDNVFVNPEAYRSFLKTGRWPDKSIF